MTNRLKLSSLNYEFRGEDYPPLPPNLYLGLSTSYINEDGSGVEEPSDSSYNRISIPRSGVSWAVEDDRFVNVFDVEFIISESSSEIIEEVFLALSPTKGEEDIVFHNKLHPSVPYYRGDGSKFIISPGTISVTWR